MATIGVLYLDGVRECYTLEDVVRADPTPDTPMTAADVAAIKVPGKTAIPAGRYRIIVTPSQRFKRDLPLLLDVPGFEGIRIHAGNTNVDTAGCILVGRERGPGAIYQSSAALEALLPAIKAGLSVGEVWIRIENIPLGAVA